MSVDSVSSGIAIERESFEPSPFLDQAHLVQATIDWMSSDEYLVQFVDVEVAEESAAFVASSLALHPRANAQAKADLRKIAAGLWPGEPSNNDRAWHAHLHNFTHSPYTIASGRTRKQQALSHHTVHIDTSYEHQEQQQQAADALDDARARAAEKLDAMLGELVERQGEPDFLRAIDAWVNTPNSRADIRDDGMGYHGGIVHFFEYWGDANKRRRFKEIDEPTSVDGFIQFTSRLKDTLDTCHLDEDIESAILEDSSGNRRFYILEPNGHFIVGFQRPEEDSPKIASFVTESTPSYFHGVVEGTLSGQDRGVLNKLGPEVTRIV